MQSEINLGGKRVLAGLQWHVVSKDKGQRSKDTRLAKDQAKKSNLQYSLVYEGEKLAALGFGSGPSTATAAAALLAEANARFLKQQDFGNTAVKKNWIVVEKIHNGEGAGLYWLGAVLDGVPAPLGDTVDDFNVISAKIADLMDLMESPEIFSTDPDLQEYVADVAPATPKSFSELVEGTTLKAGRLRKTGGIPKPVIYGGIGVLAILALYGGVTAWSNYHAEQVRIEKIRVQQEEQARLAQQSATQSAEQAREMTKKAIETAMAKVVDALANGAPAPRVSAWISTVESVALEHGNWAITGMACDAANCTVTLAREAFGTNDSLLTAQPDAKLDGDAATFVIPMFKTQEEADAKNPPTPVSASDAAAASSASAALGASAAAAPVSASAPASAPVAASAMAAPVGLVPTPAAAPAVPLGVLLGTREQFIRGIGSDLQMIRNIGVSYEVLADTPITYRPVAANPQAAQKPGAPNTTELAPVHLGISQGSFTMRGMGLWMLSGAEQVLARPGLTIESVQFGAPSAAGDSAWTIAGSYYLSTGDGPATAGLKPQESAATVNVDAASGVMVLPAPASGASATAVPVAPVGSSAPQTGPFAPASASVAAPR